MEELIKTGSISGVLAAISVMLALHLIARLGEFLWKIREKKDTLTDTCIRNLSTAVQENTLATENLDGRLRNIEATFADVSKMKGDVRRLYNILKMLTGEKWSGVKKAAETKERSTTFD